jgi:hypothetical protein
MLSGAEKRENLKWLAKPKETYRTLVDPENVFYKSGNFISHHFFKNYVSEVLSISLYTFSQSILKSLHSAAQCVLRNGGDGFCNLSLELGKVCWSSLVLKLLYGVQCRVVGW